MRTAYQNVESANNKTVTNQQQYAEVELNSHQEIATAAMLLSLHVDVDSFIDSNEDEDDSYVRGYN